MFVIDKLILLAAILILLGIVSSKLSARIGLPMLVLFLLIGMLAGKLGLVFDNPEIAHAAGTLALAFILFDGGLQTPMSSIRQVWKPASLLATLGVLLTALVTGLAAAWILGVPLLYGLLIGAIVGSTDAAAVFSLLRNAGIHINPRLKATLEIESASNDPMAIFLTVGLLEIMVNDLQPGFGLIQLFALQMGLGALVGLGVGWLALQLINRINLLATGLYPVMVAACGLLSFGVAANIGGSGFLAIFLTGVMLGNSQFIFQRTTFMFHDGLAWLSQIAMFVTLGLLINADSLFDVWQQGLLIAAALVFVARPLAVAPLLKIFDFNLREITLVSWVGLRGSVPIILAIFPLMFGLPGAELVFNVVFFVVLISATLQGSTLPLVARKLGLIEPPPATPPATLEITALGDINAEIVEYSLGPDSRAVGRHLSRLALPDGTVAAMITRDKHVVLPRGSTLLLPGDRLFVVLRSSARRFVDRVFGLIASAEETALPEMTLLLKGTTRTEDLRDSYGVHLPVADHLTLADVLYQQLGDELALAGQIELDGVRLRVHEMLGRRVTTVELHCVKPVVEDVSQAGGSVQG